MDGIQFFRTAGGSNTLFHAGNGEYYHSVHGAVQESRHVFLESGLKYRLEQKGFGPISVLEVGFGTGLNFLLSAQYCRDNQIHLEYTGIEAFPLSQEQISESGYQEYISSEIWSLFTKKYEAALQKEIPLSSYIQWEIAHREALDFESDKRYEVVYFDAFSEKVQSGMWTIQTLGHICRYLKKNGDFVTYAVNGNLKKNLRSLGFDWEKIPGASGKREMLRATKTV